MGDVVQGLLLLAIAPARQGVAQHHLEPELRRDRQVEGVGVAQGGVHIVGVQHRVEGIEELPHFGDCTGDVDLSWEVLEQEVEIAGRQRRMAKLGEIGRLHA